MKKVLSLFSALILILPLCGCSAKEAVASDKQEYIVSSLGFDGENSRLRMIIEAVVVNSDDLTSEKQNELITGTGETVKEAFAEITEKTTQPLMFSHSGVIVIGSDITPAQLEDIFGFCYEKDEINLAAMFVSTENAEELLSCRTVSSVAVGYDIMSMVEVISEEKGIVFENLFYEIESARNRPMKTLFMPNIRVQDKDFSLQGLTVVKDSTAVKNFGFSQVQALSFITDNVSNGSFLLSGTEIAVKSAKTTYDFALGDNLKITLKIRLNATGDKEKIKEEIEDIFYSAQILGEDIFMLGNVIYHQAPKIWEKIKDDYKEYFKNASLQVKINE